MKVLVAQSCPTLCNPMNCSSPDFFVLGILQAKILEWVVVSFFNSTANSDNCYVAAWVGGKCGGEWIHVDVWLSPFLVHLKLSQHCLFIGYSPIQNNCLKFVFKRRNLAVAPALSWVLTYIQCTVIFFFFLKAAQSCLTLCNPMDYIVRGTLQARILEWVAVPFSRGSSQPRDQTQVFHIAGRFFTSWVTRET